MKSLATCILFLVLLSISHQTFAQSSKGFHYQAIARDNTGGVLENTLVNLRFQIRANSPAGNLIYQEKHTPTTNALGLLSLDIGKGLVESGDFTTIPWNIDDYYLLVELNGNSLDTTLFEAVPYAKVATSMKLEDLKDVEGTPPSNNQVLSWDGNKWIPTDNAPDEPISIIGSGATSVSGIYPDFTINSTDNVNDADASTTNEIQSMALSGNTLSLSLGGGSVSLASFASPWNNSGSNLYFNTGKIGIGDNSPIATLTVGNGDKLQIHGSDGDVVFKDDQGSLRFANSNGSNAPMIQMFQSGTNNSTRMLVAHSPSFSNWGIQYNDTADAFNWIGDNLPIFHVQLSGQQRIGVGTFTPEAKVHVYENSSTGLGHLKLTETQFDYSRITMNNNIHNNFWDFAARTDTNLANAQFNIYHSDVGDILSVNARRRVGINDASPAYPLEVNGNGSRRTINAYNTLPAATGTTSNYGILSTLSQATTTGTPRLYSIFGTSTDADSYLSFGVYGRADNASNFDYGVYGRSSTTDGYAVYASGNTYTTGSYLSSDARLKSDISVLQSGLSTIMNLKPKRYQYNQEKYGFMNLPEGEQYGFLAQDIEKLLPTLTKDSFQPYDKPRSNTKEGQGLAFKAVNYVGVIPIMVSAMQEQQEIIETQNTKIKSLEDRLLKLESLLNK